MTEKNLGRHAGSPQEAFWANLKEGYDLFEADHVPPKVGVCGKRYAFTPGTDGFDGSAPIAAECPAGAAAPKT